MISFRQVFQPNFVCTSHLFHVYYMPCLSHPPQFDHPNNMYLVKHTCYAAPPYAASSSLPTLSPS